MMGFILWQRAGEHSQRRKSKLCLVCGLRTGLDSIFDWDKEKKYTHSEMALSDFSGDIPKDASSSGIVYVQ